MSMFSKHPRKPSREEQLAGLVAALREAVHRAIAESTAVQGVVFQLRMLDVVAEVTSTIDLGYRTVPERAAGPSLRLTAQDDKWLKGLRIVADDDR